VGVKTNIQFLQRLVALPLWQEGKAHTHTIDDSGPELTQPKHEHRDEALAIAAWIILQERQHEAVSPWEFADAWQGHQPSVHLVDLSMGDHDVKLRLRQHQQHWLIEGLHHAMQIHGHFIGESHALITIDHTQFPVTVVRRQKRFDIFILGEHFTLHEINWLERYAAQDATGGHLNAPMPGTVVAILAKDGQHVTSGTGLIVIEAMKMEHTIQAPADGTVTAIHFRVGDQVNEGEELLAFEAANEGKL